LLITSMDVYPIRLALSEPVPMASGVVRSTGNVLVRLVSDEGIVGWGEGVEAPALTGHRQSDIVAHLESLRDLIVGADASRITDLWLRVRAALPDASTALAAVDIAVHDLVAKTLRVPVHALLGGATRDRVPALTLVGSGNGEADAQKLAERREAGYSWFKIKLGMGSREIEWGTLARAIELVGPSGVVCGDANEAWDAENAMAFLSGLDGMPVRFVEQPVPRTDPAVLLRVATESPVAICADESASSLAAVLGFAGTDVGGVSLKLIKHGGITGVMRGAAICAEAGLGVNLAGKVIESSISAAANLHCASAMDAVDYGCSPANQGVEQDVARIPLVVTEGTFPVPIGPGLGVDVDEDLVRALSG
jgi:L-alanine-DL-glutamate epimerase-like enolase superfamily enzyme